MTFSDLSLDAALIAALEKQGILSPLPVQVEAFVPLLAGRDLYIQSATGSGKTLAYLLPLYQRLEINRDATQVLIVAPTHELALQIHRVSCDLAQHAGLPVRNVLLIGGTSLDRQIEKLKKKPQLVIGTPGRVMELADKGKLKLKDLKTVVIDEADRLMAGDSSATIEKLLKACPATRQLVYVSATARPESDGLISHFSPELVRLEVDELAANPLLEHWYLLVEDRDKPEILRKALHATGAARAIVFVHRSETAEIVAARLEHHKIAVADLHGAYEKEDRKRAMDGFRNGTFKVLITSDVGARGLDIPGITHVFNLDMPTHAKDYLHRVGRAARAGASGVAISLITEPELRLINRFARDLGIELNAATLRNGEFRSDLSSHNS